MQKQIRKCISAALLGQLMLMPAVHAEEANRMNEAAADGMEVAEPEHGKINTPDASPVDPGHIEFESTYLSTRSNHYWDNNGGTQARGQVQKQTMGLSTTIGIVENFDVTFSGNYSWIEDTNNSPGGAAGELGPTIGRDFGDVNISGRYRFLQSKEHHFELAYIGGFTLPTGSSSSQEKLGTSQEFWSFNQTLVASKDWGKWTANADIGYALPFGDKRGNAQGTFNGDVAVGYQVLPWLQPEIELNYGHTLVGGENDSKVLAATIGLVMPINERLRINTGIQQGLWGCNADKATSFYAAVKLAF